MKPFHQTNPEALASRCHTITDQVLLLNLLRMSTRPCVIITCGIIGRIFFDRIRQKHIRHLRTITISQRICSQEIFQSNRLVNDICIRRQRQSSRHQHKSSKLVFYHHISDEFSITGSSRDNYFIVASFVIYLDVL